MRQKNVLHVLPEFSGRFLRRFSLTCRLGLDANFRFFRSDLNRLVMDYLVIEGFKSAAEEFSNEAGLSVPVELDSIESRMTIREALQRGDVGEAITRVNDLNPEVSMLTPFVCEWQRKRIKTFSCTTLRPLEVADDTCKHQNFSLQYDVPHPNAGFYLDSHRF